MKRMMIFAGFTALIAVASGQQAAPPFQRNSETTPVLTSIAGPDRTVIIPARTFLNGYVGFGDPPRPVRGQRGQAAPPPPAPPGPGSSG